MYQYALAATDPDGDPLSYLLQNGPQGMTIDGNTGQVNWMPNGDQLGINDVHIAVDDGQGGVVTQSFAINVVAPVINSSPNITSVPSQSATLGELYQYAVFADDPDGDPLVYVLENGPDGMTIDELILVRCFGHQLKISWATVNVEIRVLDGQQGAITQSFAINVRSLKPCPPMITSVPPTLGFADESYFYQVGAEDPEGGTIDFALASAPAGMTIDPQSGLLFWPSDESAVGLFEFSVFALDPRGAASIQTYTLKMEATRPNDPPAITSTPSFSAVAEQPYEYQVTSFDGDGDAVTYSLVSAPTGVQIDEATRA